MVGDGNAQPAAADALPYQVSAALRQRLDLIHHLLGFGRQVIAVSGAPGSGRSRLLGQLASEAAPGWLLVPVGGETIGTPNDLYRAVLAACGGAPDAAGIDAVRAALDAQHAAGRLVVLLADDADSWDQPLGEALFALAQREEGDGELRAVVTCGSEAPCIGHLQAAAPTPALLHLLEIPALPEPLMLALVEQAAARAGIPLDDAQCAHLATEGAGNPARALAALASFDTAEAAAPSSSGGLRGRIAGVSVVALAALALLGLALYERVRDTETSSTPPVQLILPPSRPSIAPAPDTPVASDPQAEDAAAADAEAPPAPEPRITDAPAPAATAVPPAAEPEAPPVPVPAPEAAAEPVPAPVPATAERGDPGADAAEETGAPAATMPPPRPSEEMASDKPGTSTYTPKWVLTNKDSDYVIQLFGTRTRAAAESFIARHRLGEQAAVMALEHEGAPWFVVVHGLFADRAAAKSAIAALEGDLAGRGAWPRSIASLRE